jgi:hypothetical protein
VSEEREFSLEEANGLLPSLRESLGRIREARQVILRSGERVRRSASMNGEGVQGKEYWESLSTLKHEVEALAGKGIILRDPESGLIDFPSRVDGEPAFLCWRLGEDRIGFWHGPETGFAGRRPL